MQRTLLKACTAIALTGALVGCAGPKTLYSWNNYNQQVYSYLKNEALPTEQILAMEESVQKANARQQTLPPGFYAHLGMMYLNAGKTDQALSAWAHEKAVFPESTQYIDYLISNLKKNQN